MQFNGLELLPAPADGPGYLEAIHRYLLHASCLPVKEILRRFFMHDLDPASLHIGSVHHVAVYLGDYTREEQWESLLEFMKGTTMVTELSWGPSHIAPHYYGVPGHWAACRLGGLPAELFALKQGAGWSQLLLAERQRRMSHYALAVDQALRVRPLLDYLGHYPDIELLAYAPLDPLGHTYGHLRHRPTGSVIELVHQA